MLVDDDPITSVILTKINSTLPFAKELVSFYSAVDGLDYLTNLHETNRRQPEVIFLGHHHAYRQRLAVPGAVHHPSGFEEHHLHAYGF